MANRLHDLPTREVPHEPAEDDSDAESAHLSDSPTLVQPGAFENTGQDPKEEKRRTSFLRRRFSSKWSQKKEHASEESIRGPLGLQLLFASPEPLVEIVFVHGLRGGSVKTWQKGNDPRLFWPQHWLPTEPDFRNASIHSFGYESDWKSSAPSILSVHDFGQALYEELRTSASLRQNPKNAILLVGHSMGGLVIKRAYTLAQQDSSCSDIFDRIRSIFFLATPHRGSDYAALLNNILKVSGFTGISSSRDYVDDLSVGSRSTQLINDEFGRISGNLAIHSFYETLQTKIGLSSLIIVDKNSAVLAKIEAEATSNAELRLIKSFLGTPERSDEYHDILEGSCQWIDDREDFKDWRGSQNFENQQKHKPSIYWVTASPGAGKTVLAAHVVSQLGGFGLQSAAYHFHMGKKESQTLSGFLRSVALQMAHANATIRKAVLKICVESASLDLDDPRVIWSRIFRAGIFQVPVPTSQYWVIDAIDECINYAEFFSLFKDTQIWFPLRIFVTSRKLADMPKVSRQLTNTQLSVVEIPLSHTMTDIQLYVQSRIADLPVGTEDEKIELTKDIISKSNASFLWVRLVMDELEGVYGYESVVEVLHGIPEGMISYYQRTIAKMAENKRERHISKAILQWVALAARPLTISELSHAVELDVKTHLANPKPAIEGLCGHLVVVSEDHDVVHILHNTAREFLFSEDAGEFGISKTEGHERIVLACLQLLTGPDMQPPRHRRQLEQTRTRPKVSILLDYAVIYFSEHIFHSSASNEQVISALDKFFSTTATSWIEKVLKDGNMHRLVRTARNLRGYLDRRSKYSSSLGRHYTCVDKWATDLSRLAIKFAGALSANPQSIYFLIPPFCPKKTAIHRQIRQSPDSLKVLGLDDHWDDCIATLNFGEKAAATVSTGETLIAVAFEGGDIYLHNHRSYEVETVIHSDFSVNLIHFDTQASFIAASSRKFLTLWDLQGKMLWKARLRGQCILLASCSAFVLGITQQGKAVRWDIKTGELLEEHHFIYQPPADPGSSSGVPSKAPSVASVSPNLELLALAYRNGPVCIFDLQTNELIGWAIDNNSRAPEQLMFNPNPEVDLLLIAYNESHLATFDSWSGTLYHEQASSENIIMNSLTCSKTGHTFATVDIRGNLRVWDFETLTVLYHIITPSQSFRVLSFTADGLTLLDMAEHQMKIWSPSALLRKTIEEESSTSDQLENLTVPDRQYETLRSAKVSAMIGHPVADTIFLGKNNGHVCSCSSKDEQVESIIYSHEDIVNHITTCQAYIIASSDLFNIVKVKEFSVNSNTVKVEGAEFQFRPKSSIRQLLFDPSGAFLLVSTVEADNLYDTSTGVLLGSLLRESGDKCSWKWVSLQLRDGSGIFALIQNHQIALYCPSTFPRPRSTAIDLDYRAQGLEDAYISTAEVASSGSYLALEICYQDRHVSKSYMATFQLLAPASESIMQSSPLDLVPADVFKQLLGFTSDNRMLVFLSKDSWVCSVDVNQDMNTTYTQHFFVPSEFITSNNILPRQASGDTIIFSLYDRAIVVRNGLKVHEGKSVDKTTTKQIIFV
ncbi:Vegetative incompatibility protein [Paramyrothecium foliicola]|nr:Vegetative incompatibility protein [Paramyrothecium foliicola]